MLRIEKWFATAGAFVGTSKRSKFELFMKSVDKSKYGAHKGWWEKHSKQTHPTLKSRINRKYRDLQKAWNDRYKAKQKTEDEDLDDAILDAADTDRTVKKA